MQQVLHKLFLLRPKNVQMALIAALHLSNPYLLVSHDPKFWSLRVFGWKEMEDPFVIDVDK